MTHLKAFEKSGLALLCVCGGALAQSTAVQPARNRPAQNSSTRARTAPREVPPQQFDSPDQAVAALLDAASKNDEAQLTTILGSRGKILLSSGNAAQDKQDRQEFMKRAMAKRHVERSAMDANAAVLLVGDQDWPFPIPLVQSGQKWQFDAERGAEEMSARRIGANELDAIEICMGYVNAQQSYAAQKATSKAPPSYAQNIMGSADGKEGLYQAGGNDKLVPQGLARASWSTPAADRKPYHGYYFRVLKEQGDNAMGGAHKYVANGVMIGGFALIAWPAEYGVTGIHTFIVDHDDKVFEKDLGPTTGSAATQIIRYDPDKSWTQVE